MAKGATIPVKQITSWSYSRWRDHQDCPRYAHMKHILKIPEGDPSPAMLRGGEIAKASEDYLLKKTKALAPELQSFKEDYEFFRNQKSLFAEQMWGFDKNWAPVAWNDWTNCWARVKIDMGYTDMESNAVVIRDGKSGKYKENDHGSYLLQLELYVAAAASQYPKAEFFVPQLMYTDAGVLYPAEAVAYDRDDAIKFQKAWEKRVKPMLADKRFPPKPGNKCRYCAYSKAKGGKCEY